MTKKRKQTPQSSPLSKEPYKRREESEIIRILTEIDKGLISKLGACKKYGLNRNRGSARIPALNSCIYFN